MMSNNKSNPQTGDSAEDEVYEKICQAWNTLDPSVLAPYLSDDLFYDSCYWGEPMNDKKSYLEYLSNKFKVYTQPGQEKPQAQIEEDKGLRKPFVRVGNIAGVYDVMMENGLVTKMLIRPPYSRFDFTKFDEVVPEMAEIALHALTDYFSQHATKPCGWLQTTLPQIRFQDLCLAYDQYVLSIVVGLVRKTLEEGVQVFVHPQEYKNLLRECETYQMTPCIFLIDSAGNPFMGGCHLIDARTQEPIDLDHLKEDNGGKMSDWEIHCMGVNMVCSYLAEQGYTCINSCDIPAISPQIFFEDEGKPCYAIVRSVPEGLADQKVTVSKALLEQHADKKGYFVDVRWSWLWGGTGQGKEKLLYRGQQIKAPNRGGRSNLLYNKLELIAIDKAIKEYPFIEVVED